jgi:hypothetical protein
LRISRRSSAEQRIVGRRDAERQHQRIEIDIAAIPGRFALDMIDRERADIDMLAIVRPGSRGVICRIVRLADRDDQMPLQRRLLAIKASKR